MACPSIPPPCTSYEAGPYDWFSKPNPPIGGANPAFVTYNDSSSGTTKYTLWADGKIHSADSVDGPYTVVGSSPCGSNPVRPARPFLSSFSFYNMSVWLSKPYGSTCGERRYNTMVAIGLLRCSVRKANAKPPPLSFTLDAVVSTHSIDAFQE